MIRSIQTADKHEPSRPSERSGIGSVGDADTVVCRAEGAHFCATSRVQRMNSPSASFIMFCKSRSTQVSQASQTIGQSVRSGRRFADSIPLNVQTEQRSMGPVCSGLAGSGKIAIIALNDAISTRNSSSMLLPHAVIWSPNARQA